METVQWTGERWTRRACSQRGRGTSQFRWLMSEKGVRLGDGAGIVLMHVSQF